MFTLVLATDNLHYVFSVLTEKQICSRSIWKPQEMVSRTDFSISLQWIGITWPFLSTVSSTIVPKDKHHTVTSQWGIISFRFYCVGKAAYVFLDRYSFPSEAVTVEHPFVVINKTFLNWSGSKWQITKRGFNSSHEIGCCNPNLGPSGQLSWSNIILHGQWNKWVMISRNGCLIQGKFIYSPSLAIHLD